MFITDQYPNITLTRLDFDTTMKKGKKISLHQKNEFLIYGLVYILEYQCVGPRWCSFIYYC